jgi:hypothetical protein
MGSIRLLRGSLNEVNFHGTARWRTRDLAELPPLREAEICESTGHKNAQPTHPERNAQAADLYLPSKDDPQQMHYRHHKKQRGGGRHVGSLVQPACPSPSLPNNRDDGLRFITGSPYAAGHVGLCSPYRLITLSAFSFPSFASGIAGVASGLPLGVQGGFPRGLLGEFCIAGLLLGFQRSLASGSLGNLRSG